MNTDPNLLFGVLALQLQLLDDAQFASACTAWAAEPARPLPEVLLARGWLTPERRHQVDQLLAVRLGQPVASTPVALSASAFPSSSSCLETLLPVKDPTPGREAASLDSQVAETIPPMSNSDRYATLPPPASFGAAAWSPSRSTPCTPHGETLPTPKARTPAGEALKTPSQSAETIAPQHSAGAAAALARPIERPTRYTIVGLLGEGGLGRVYLCRDNDLNREVALKEVKEQANDSDSIRRFLKEAQITGQLEHPNIVPVYELGRRTQDEPFYTMRRMQGQTLREASAEHHRRVKAGTAEPLEQHRLLEAFVSVCQALGYAHARGIIHRDLKPDNVMLGAFGEVVVLDWGLAKHLGQPDDPRDLRPVALSLDSETEATLAGQAMGTPAYMAPEQAEGRLDLIDARTDIYGLGAILFELVTGRRPHTTGASTLELLQHIIDGETPLARTVRPDLPPALEAICARAMAKAPADRYTTALELATDVQRFLADEPVSVWREPWLVRAVRWARRHRTVVAAAVVLLATAVPLLVLMNIRGELEQSRTEAARVQAQANFEEAERQRRQTRQTVDAYFTQVSDHPTLADTPGMQPIRRQLLEKARGFFEQFVKEQCDDPERQAELAAAYQRLGRIADAGKDRTGALAALDKARALQEQLLAADPGNTAYARDLALSHYYIGLIQRETLDQLDAALRSLSSARDLLVRVVETDSADEQARSDLARCLSSLGNLLYTKKSQPDEALRAFEEARTMREQLLATRPTDAGFRRDLATSCTNVANLLMLGPAERRAEALPRFRQAEELLNELVRTNPGKTELQLDLASLHYNLGYYERLQNKPQEVLQQWQEARSRYEVVIYANPAVRDAQKKLAQVCSDLGGMHRLDKQLDKALRHYQQACDIQEILVAADPQATDPQEKLARTYYNLGQLYREQKRDVDALRHYEKAREKWKLLQRSYPNNPTYQSELKNTEDRIGDVKNAKAVG